MYTYKFTVTQNTSLGHSFAEQEQSKTKSKHQSRFFRIFECQMKGAVLLSLDYIPLPQERIVIPLFVIRSSLGSS